VLVLLGAGLATTRPAAPFSWPLLGHAYERMGRSRLRGNSSTHSSSSSRELTPPLLAHDDNWDSESAMSNSRPTSLAIPRAASPGVKLPTLPEILSNSAPPPWTLSAFTAYLSQNHCLETLEFLLDAERYCNTYASQSAALQGQSSEMEGENLCSLWHRLMQTYIMPYSPRELNVPAPVREHLLRLKCAPDAVPPPSELDEAVTMIRELMTDSCLVPFVESLASPSPGAVSATSAGPYNEDVAVEARKSKSRLRIPMDLISTDETSHSPKTSFLPLFLGRSSPVANRSAAASAADPFDFDLTPDDSNSPDSTPADEPMTPPTTPPTSDFTFSGSASASPNTLQRAISGTSWKRMGARLGLSKKGRTIRRSQPTNVPTMSNPIEPVVSNRSS
jgi:hypothetical protein